MCTSIVEIAPAEGMAKRLNGENHSNVAMIASAASSCWILGIELT